MKCPECSITVPEMPEDATWWEQLCNDCHDKQEAADEEALNKKRHPLVAGNHSECGPDCCVTGDLCCGGHVEGACPTCDAERSQS